ncbi:MAG: aspartate aminotransferase family protein [Gammaproteobacteria bacterium]|nr:MAG: aspartate aminotransferase family protein [Gammaproteobacteria bacterium]
MTETALIPAYARLPIAFEKGEGVHLYDTDGKKYIDALSGIGVCGLGHCHPAVSAAVQHQVTQLVHTSNIYNIPLQEKLGQQLAALSGMKNCFFSNSGAEANEAAIKIARLYGHKKNIESPAIIVMEGAFHGRTLATLSATSNRKVQAGFEPLVSGFIRAPFNDIEALQTIAKNNQSVVAVFLEPIQGEGGINLANDDYLKQVREICDQNQWLMMLDEIQTGNGRTGKYFCYQHSDILPDVVTTAKGLANGIPIGVCMAANQAAELIQPGNHGSTYGGNPLACAAAIAVLDTLQKESLFERAEALGIRIRDGLEKSLGKKPYCSDIRGKGLMIGVELSKPCTQLIGIAAEQGLLLNVTAERVIRLLPPLILSDAEADELVAKLSEIVINFVEES